MRVAAGETNHSSTILYDLHAAASLKGVPQFLGALARLSFPAIMPRNIGFQWYLPTFFWDRGISMSAIRSLFAYAALRHPDHAERIQRVLAIPAKRTDRQLVSFLTQSEVNALLAAPDPAKCSDL